MRGAFVILLPVAGLLGAYACGGGGGGYGTTGSCTDDGCTPFYADETGLVCIQCRTDADCTDAPAYPCHNGSRCLADNTCGCHQDADCAVSGGQNGSACVAGQCGCRTSADCPSQYRNVCDVSISICVWSM